MVHIVRLTKDMPNLMDYDDMFEYHAFRSLDKAKEFIKKMYSDAKKYCDEYIDIESDDEYDTLLLEDEYFEIAVSDCYMKGKVLSLKLE